MPLNQNRTSVQIQRIKLSLNVTSFFYTISVIILNSIETQRQNIFAHTTKSMQFAEISSQYIYIAYICNSYINIHT